MADYKAADIAFENVMNDFPATKLKSKIFNYILNLKRNWPLNSIYTVLKKERLDNALAFTRTVEKNSRILIMLKML